MTKGPPFPAKRPATPPAGVKPRASPGAPYGSFVRYDDLSGHRVGGALTTPCRTGLSCAYDNMRIGGKAGYAPVRASPRSFYFQSVSPRWPGRLNKHILCSLSGKFFVTGTSRSTERHGNAKST